MNVVSYFNGMNCGMLALDKAEIKVYNYYSYEIDKYANMVSQKNYPNTKQMGSVVDADLTILPKIDLMIGGSPCQGFSFAGKQLNFEDERSKLFFDFVKAKDFLKPKYFLLENVKMKKESQDIISKYLGCEPKEIWSSKFLPHNRKRLYWTNINFEEPTQVDWNINDFYEGEGFPSSGTLHKNPRRVEFRRKEIFNTMTATMYKGINASGRPAVSLRESFYYDDRDAHRMLTPNECEGLQGVPKDYTDCVSNTQRYKMLGNGWTVDVIAHIFKGMSKPTE